MPSQLFSFRLKDAVAEAVLAKALPGETASMTAQRLLTEAVGMETVNSKKVVNSSQSALKQNSVNSEKTVDSVVNSLVTEGQTEALINSLVNSDVLIGRLEEKLTSLVASQEQKIREAEERLEALEKLEA